MADRDYIHRERAVIDAIVDEKRRHGHAADRFARTTAAALIDGVPVREQVQALHGVEELLDDGSGILRRVGFDVAVDLFKVRRGSRADADAIGLASTITV
jgi:hypothetical protein